MKKFDILHLSNHDVIKPFRFTFLSLPGIDDNVSMGPSEDRQATARVNSGSTGRSSSDTIKSRPSISNEKLVANIQQVSTHGNVGTDDECYEYDPQNESNEEEDESFYDEYTISNSFEGSRHGSAMDANVKDFDHDEDDEEDEDEDEDDDENEVEDEDEYDDESDNGMERNNSAKSGGIQNIGWYTLFTVNNFVGYFLFRLITGDIRPTIPY